MTPFRDPEANAAVANRTRLEAWGSAALLICGMGYGGYLTSQRNALGAKPACFRNGSSGEAGLEHEVPLSICWEVQGIWRAQKLCLYTLQWVSLPQGARRYPQPSQEQLPNPSLLAAEDAQPAASWFVRPLAH